MTGKKFSEGTFFEKMTTFATGNQEITASRIFQVTSVPKIKVIGM